jgi:hypothetical protein
MPKNVNVYSPDIENFKSLRYFQAVDRIAARG